MDDFESPFAALFSKSSSSPRSSEGPSWPFERLSWSARAGDDRGLRAPVSLLPPPPRPLRLLLTWREPCSWSQAIVYAVTGNERRARQCRLPGLVGDTDIAAWLCKFPEQRKCGFEKLLSRVTEGRKFLEEAAHARKMLLGGHERLEEGRVPTLVGDQISPELFGSLEFISNDDEGSTYVSKTDENFRLAHLFVNWPDLRVLLKREFKNAVVLIKLTDGEEEMMEAVRAVFGGNGRFPKGHFNDHVHECNGWISNNKSRSGGYGLRSWQRLNEKLRKAPSTQLMELGLPPTLSAD